jgi:hypothetical protein
VRVGACHRGLRSGSRPGNGIRRQVLIAGTFMATSLLCAASVFSEVATGIISTNISGQVRLYSPLKLSPDERVRFQYPDEAGITRCCITRSGNAFEAVEADDAVSDALSGNPVFTYRMSQVPAPIGKAPFMGAAVIGRSVSVKQITDRSLRVGATNSTLTVSMCTSLEGLHVMTKSGAKVVADLYLGFDYAVADPICPID